MASNELDLEQALRELQASSFVLPNAEQPELHCDLVMKGGITSGVVYPLAVLNLARRYRFHSIGGTSAGAIAAAVTAAAEYARETGGFARLVDTVRELQQPGFLANVFQPTQRLRPLLQLLFLILDFKRRLKEQTDFIPTRLALAGGVAQLLWALTLAPAHLAALVGGAIGAAIGALGASGWIVAATQATIAGKAAWQLLWGLLLILACGWIGGLIGTLARLLLTELPANYYGVCSGRPVPDHARNRLVPADQPDSPALTDWLAHTIDRIAGMPDRTPLTFGMLRAKQVRRPGQAKPEPIVLNTVTTNLSQGQPYVLPFADKQYLFSAEEFYDLFPNYVVQHMIDNARPSERFATPFTIVDAHGRSHTLRFLPESDQLPAILGARMSLSFPLLLSAVPLWTISRDAFAGAEFRNRAPGRPFTLRAEHMRRNWFSDGGICSNFPIHFYDKLLPPYPTFGINLGQLSIKDDAPADGQLPGLDFQWEEQPASDADPAAQAQSTAPGAHVPDTSVALPSSYPRDRPGPLWQPLDDSLPGFLGSILNTGLFYRDTMQSRLPSYYDRIVTIYLGDREGGINLDMPPSTIAKIAGKGYLAADEILSKFNFTHHTWVRMRLLLGKLEQELLDLHKPLFEQQPPQIDPARLAGLVGEITGFLEENGVTHNSVQRVLAAQLAAFPDERTRFPYPRDDAWARQVLPQLYVFLLMIQQWGSAEHAHLQLGDLDMTRDELHKQDDHIRLRVTPDL